MSVQRSEADAGSAGVASLPMYDLASLQDATDAWWEGLRRYLVSAGVDHVPPALSRIDDCYAHWLSDDLVLSQACGYPLTHALAGKVRYVATPHYDLPGCAGPVYRSAIICRMGDARAVKGLGAFAGSRAAVNGFDSQSGYLALAACVHTVCEPGVPFFRKTVETGTHLASLDAVREGRADLCAADCVTYGLIRRYDPGALEGLAFLCWSPSAPGLPIIASERYSNDMIGRFRDGLNAAVAAPELKDCRAVLGIVGMSVLTHVEYDVIPALEARICPARIGLSK